MLEGDTPEEDPGPDAYHKLGDVEAGPCACLFFFFFQVLARTFLCQASFHIEYAQLTPMNFCTRYVHIHNTMM